ncbi:diguanylate cyclase [Paracoccus gahaiensis]|uniref:diguanylate cyclase n=1 Tax=Paracoccus gahaiensis TaxID=1706839 RepID=A0A4U0REE8_9RHOB|nr:diguanylate cyclase [Paracoccus gahaiensis]TJZ93801.1 diguanylate cyclase [Paracoccus gahaiensis]
MTARILVADGTATVRITLKVRLTAVCHDVVALGSGAQLMAQLDLGRPDLIILGDGLADGPAVAWCRRLAADPRTCDIPVLMLTGPDQRLAALQAGATATLDSNVDDQMLMARIRTILREVDLPQTVSGMAEAQSGFDHAQRPLISLIASHPSRALRWRQMLSDRMTCRFEVQDPDQALSAATAGRTADLYLIAADLRARGDGLRLLSELRSRPGSRDAGFVIAIAPDRAELASIALDLGAGDVMPDCLTTAQAAQAAAMSLQLLLSRKTRSDQRRADMDRQIRLAMIDPLTGLYNRRYALPRLAEIAQQAVAGGRHFAVFVVDLDHFKTVNDRHGHSAGDAVLSEMARRLREALGSEGLVARMGGEEFLGVLDDCPPHRAHPVGEALRRAVQDRPVALPNLSGGGLIPVTASVGLACGGPEDMDGGDQLGRLVMERADRALRSAKASGRNRVVSGHRERAA